MLPEILTATSNDIVQLVVAMFPGFLAIAVSETLTLSRKYTPFERVVQALLYTFLSGAIWSLAVFICNSYALGYDAAIGALHRPWLPSKEAEFWGTGASALALGVLAAWVINDGRVSAWIRHPKLGLTKAGPGAPVWYHAFQQLGTWVVIHLKDGRRLYGWPENYSPTPESGHIRLSQAEWLTDAGAAHEQRDGFEIAMLVNVADIEIVEFLCEVDKEEVEDADKSQTPEPASS